MKILITGSSSGIGRAICEKMLAANHTIIGLARFHDKFSPQNENYLTYSIDFSLLNHLEENLKKIIEKHPDIDAIVCSSGYGEFAELEQFSFKKMQKLMNVNFLSQALLVKLILPKMKKNKKGQIILIGSECSLEGQKKGSIYCASKFALRGFSQSIRKECVSSSISVTLINPGMVDTPFFDHLSFAPAEGEEYSIDPKQIADMVSLILSKEDSCVYEEINLQPMKKNIISRIVR